MSQSLPSPSPLEALKHRWEEASRRRLDALLERHGAALAPAEREVYASVAAVPDGTTAHTREQRRALVGRLLRAKIYRRRGVALASSAWVRAVPETAGTPAGPYNSLAALEETLRRVAAAHPEWVAEFLDLYGGMQAIRKSYGESAGKK